MIVVVDDKKYRIRWRYRHIDPPHSYDKMRGNAQVQAMVTCFIYTGEEDEHTVACHAYCSTKDVFRRKIGRNLSALRAMKALGLNKSQRETVWMQMPHIQKVAGV